MKITFLILVAFILLGSTTASASQGQGMGDTERVQDPTIHEGANPPAPQQGNAVENQAKTATQNMGEEQQLQVMTQEEMMLQDGEGEGMEQSKVTRALNKLEQLKDVKGLVGQELSEIATAQTQAQDKIAGSLTKLKQKSTFAKRLFGPDYQALNNLKTEYDQNQLRIESLETLMTETENEADAAELQLAIDAFTEQNTALDAQIQEEETTPSIFGWLVRLFNR